MVPVVRPGIIRQYLLAQTYARVQHYENISAIKLGQTSLEHIRAKFGPPSEGLKALLDEDVSQDEHLYRQKEVRSLFVDRLLLDTEVPSQGEGSHEDLLSVMSIPSTVWGHLMEASWDGLWSILSTNFVSDEIPMFLNQDALKALSPEEARQCAP